MKLQKKLTFYVIPLLVLLLSSCSTTYLEFNAQKNADSRYDGLKTLAINRVILKKSTGKRLIDTRGNWTVQEKKIDTRGLERLARKSLVANLHKFSNYTIIDLEDFAALQDKKFDLLRPLSAQKIGKVDFLVDVFLSVYVQDQEGQGQEVMGFVDQETRKQGKRWVRTKDLKIDKVVSVPYSQAKVELNYFVEAIETRNGSFKSLKNFNGTLVNDQSPRLPAEGMLNELGVVVSLKLLKNISRYSVITRREIDDDGDDTAVDLLHRGKVDQARTKLEGMANKRDKNPADLYNLGICYEAIGEATIARQYYENALSLDEGNSLYINAIGAVQ